MAVLLTRPMPAFCWPLLGGLVGSRPSSCAICMSEGPPSDKLGGGPLLMPDCACATAAACAETVASGGGGSAPEDSVMVAGMTCGGCTSDACCAVTCTHSATQGVA